MRRSLKLAIYSDSLSWPWLGIIKLSSSSTHYGEDFRTDAFIVRKTWHVGEGPPFIYVKWALSIKCSAKAHIENTGNISPVDILNSLFHSKSHRGALRLTRKFKIAVGNFSLCQTCLWL